MNTPHRKDAWDRLCEHLSFWVLERFEQICILVIVAGAVLLSLELHRHDQPLWLVAAPLAFLAALWLFVVAGLEQPTDDDPTDQ